MNKVGKIICWVALAEVLYCTGFLGDEWLKKLNASKSEGRQIDDIEWMSNTELLQKYNIHTTPNVMETGLMTGLMTLFIPFFAGALVAGRKQR